MRRSLLPLAVLLWGCASTSAAPTLYLLRAEAVRTDEALAAIAPVESPARFGLGAVELAPYLDQSGIVVETRPGQLHVANHHLWAEPLEAGLHAALRESLSRALGTEVSTHRTLRWEHEIQVTVDRLHGTMDGEALLDARYRIARTEGEPAVVEYRFSRSSALAEEGYAALVAAEGRLLEALARAIADSLREIGAL